MLPQFLSLTPSSDPWKSLSLLEHRAAFELGRLEGMVAAAPQWRTLLATWPAREALASCRIEGVEADMLTVAKVLVPRSRGWEASHRTIWGYLDALKEGAASLSSGQLLKASFVRALHGRMFQFDWKLWRQSGAWRGVQVSVGRHRPPPPYALSGFLENWEAFLKRDDLNPLVQAAVMHGQFELIHPFVDGNGRMGRLLIPLFLAEKGATSIPLLLLSPTILSRRRTYYAALDRLSLEGDWDGWIRFFLECAADGCMALRGLFSAMRELWEKSSELIRGSGRSPKVDVLLRHLFRRPLFTVPDLRSSLGVSPQATAGLVKRLQRAGLAELVWESEGTCPAYWSFPALLRLLE